LACRPAWAWHWVFAAIRQDKGGLGEIDAGCKAKAALLDSCFAIHNKKGHTMMNVQASQVPSFSAVRDSLHTAYFYDCYAIEIPPDSRSPLALYLDVVSRTPRWIDFLMKLRNKIVAQLGLKDMGRLSGIDSCKPVQSYGVGDRAGIFKVLELREHEVILGETDKHLDVKLSVTKQEVGACVVVSVSTVVHVHNFTGRLYMFFVKPAHRIIAPVTVSTLAHRAA
jgi:hypothetical protein